MPVELRTLTVASRLLLFVFVLALIVSTVRQGVASYYYRQNLPDALQKAMTWDPANPVYPAALANLVHLYGQSPDPDEVIRLYQTAVRLSPFDAGYTADLAQANDWAGRTEIALPLFQRAQQLFPNSPEINWKLANFYIRSGNISDALPALKKVLSSSIIEKNQVFALSDRAGLSSETVIDKLLPSNIPAYFAYLNFETQQGNFSAAQETWNRLLSLGSPFESKEALPFLDTLIRAHELDIATQVWSSLVSRFPDRIPSPASATNLITNGNLQADILDGAFDWRVFPVSGVAVAQDSTGPSAGNRSLQVEFDGTQNLYYGSVLQFVPAQPRTKYTFSAFTRSQAITTDAGIGVQISDGYDANKILGSTDPLIGTTPWSEQSFTFETPPETRLLIVRIVRFPSQKLDNKIAGAFWLSRVLLTPRKAPQSP
jgi:cytochrome c-type biogenesis protein CcmH/NrfG